MDQPLHRVIVRIPEVGQSILNMSLPSARSLLAGTDPTAIHQVEGTFALVARVGDEVRLARSLDRPLRYFLAKEASGPMLVVAERIDEIAEVLTSEGYLGQFHPSYTRMVPAHHVTVLRLIGCPDPNPIQRRFFAPPRATGTPDLDVLGRNYVGALRNEVERWLAAQPTEEPIGVLFSGGVDSGAVLLAVYRALLDSGQSPARLKAFTLDAGGGRDISQAQSFLDRLDLGMLHETISVDADSLDPWRAIEVIEDYKPLDVECATVALAALQGIRERYPEWRLMVDGDGGDENLKDYPLEEGAELTIRSVVGNSMLYQEGWGVDAIKHSQVYSGGYSRACVRTFAPLRHLAFTGFSPFTRPEVVRQAEAIPFDTLTQGSNQRLYALKGEIVSRGMKAVYGLDFPVFEKRRFQHGALGDDAFEGRFGIDPERYRQHFQTLYRSVS